MKATRPSIAVRLLLLGALAAFGRLDENPLVRLEALLGLSPSPLERFVGIRGPFSGMTEASFQLLHLQIAAALRANVLVIPILGMIGAAILCWRAPRMSSAGREIWFFAAVVAGTAINNLPTAWIGAG
ncbi:MAG: hypothetical protein QOD42_2500 [Sphingomonadales bacterium]|jgi:hypothetical protein|nr:hypothetical protein [Sphingomonadales bacterium]